MSDTDEIRGFLVDLKGGLERIEGKIDAHGAWMETHAAEHAAMRRERGAATVCGKLAAFFAGIAVFFVSQPGGH